MYEVVISPRARHDLLDILDYIAEDSPSAAERFGAAVLDHVSLLAQFPHIGEPVSARPGIRKVLHTPIRIYYRINEEKQLVEVLHFWHGARLDPQS